MENNNQKTNPILRGFKAFGHYIKNVFIDFIASFKYNNMKLPAILIALPGILIGFFLIFHIPTIRKVIPNYTRSVEGSNASGTIIDDVEAYGTKYYSLIIANGLKYNGKEYTNVLLKRKTQEVGSGNKLETPVLANVSFDDGQINFSVSENSEVAALIDSYNVFVYQKVDNIDYIVHSYAKVTYGSVLKFSDYTNDSSVEYSLAVQAIPKTSDTENVISEISNKVAFKPTSKSSSYNPTNYSQLKYAGLYEAVSGLDDNLKTYELEIKANGDAVVLMNGVESTARFSSAAGTTSYSLVATETVYVLPFNYSGMVLFGLMLLGILNIFFSLSISGKKNLASVVKSIVTTGLMVVLAIFYIYAIFKTENLLKSGDIQISVTSIIDSDTIMSITFIIVSLVTSIVGCVLGLIFYDRNYEKVTF